MTTSYITGIGGCIGSAIFNQLQNLGVMARGCDLRPHSHSRQLDILNTEALAIDMEGCATVFHCAAMLGVEHTENFPERCAAYNIEGTQSVIEAAKRAGVEHFVMLSSSEVYGKQEPKSDGLSETDRLLGSNVYAKSKIRNELDVLAIDCMRTTVLRMFNTFGPRQVRQFVIPRFMYAALFDQPIYLFGAHKHARAYLYSQDAAAHILNVISTAPNRSVVNIAGDEPYTLRELANEIIGICGSRSEVIVQQGSYNDREVSRDIPWRAADLSLLRKYSSHETLPFAVTLELLKSQFGSTYDTWVFQK
jgi:UDP-glucose 4-epimerase